MLFVYLTTNVDYSYVILIRFSVVFYVHSKIN